MTEVQKPATPTALRISVGRRIKIFRHRLRGLDVGAELIDGSRTARSQKRQDERRTWSVLNLPWHNKW